MIEIYIFFIFLLLFFFLNKFLIKSEILLDKIHTSDHKNFLNKSRVPLSGGILSLVLIIFFFENIDYLNKFLFFLIFLIGVMSDTNKVNSPIIRLLSQVIIVAILLIKNETYVIDTRFEPIDLLINDFFYFKIFFSIFCFVVLIL